MAATIKGLGVVFGVGSQTYTGGIVSDATTAQSTPQSIRLSRTADEVKVKTIDGQVIGAIFSGFMKTVSLTVIPSAATVAGAGNAAADFAPAPGTSVTIVDSLLDGTTAAGISDNWLVMSATTNRTVDGVATIDLELEASEENEIAGAAL